MRRDLSLATLALLFCINASAAEEFSFDIASYEKKNYQINGFLQGNIDHQVVADDSYASRLFFLNTPERDAVTENSAALELAGEYRKDDWYTRATFHAEAYDSELDSDQEGSFYEALLAYQPNPGMTFEVGKKALKWGKGYAWSPVGFVERPKDPDDPELAREGYVVATADLIKSYDGDLKTLALTPVYLPVTDSVNDEYGEIDHHNMALKLYALYKDVDMDVMFLREGSRSQRYGFDFSRNLSTNFEVHGEWAFIDEVKRQVVSGSGSISSEKASATQWLLGLRYLTENETTIIAEYYRNNGGYSSTEMEDYFRAVESAFATSNTALLKTLAAVGGQSYLLRNPGREYLYWRVSNKEPFDWLYFTPAVTLMRNLQDGSFSLAPELLYTAVENLELRFKATLLRGKQYSEFGEKRNQQRYEFRLRYFF